MKEYSDILSLFEALSSHEVFTPPRVARQMLDLLPESIWENPSIRMLDPATKSGVFLREAFFRFYTGLSKAGMHEGQDGVTYDLAKPQQRINHILRNMLFGIAISELTSYMSRRTLYGVMHADSDKQIASLDSFEQSSNFDQWSERDKLDFVGRNAFNEYFDHRLFSTPDYEGFESEGNIFYPVQEVQRLVELEDSFDPEDTYFPFIEPDTEHLKILNIKNNVMKFDVIVGNPPYQVRTSGHGRQARPIYHLFVKKAIKLNPRYIVMVTPSRWFSGGMGLSSFRTQMQKDRRLRAMVDIPNSKECFPGVSISGGVNYFLWDKRHNGPCEFTSLVDGKKDSFSTTLDEFPVVIRRPESKSILDKVKALEEPTLSTKVSPINVFDLSSSFRGSVHQPGFVKVTHSKGEGFVDPASVKQVPAIADKFKVVVSRTIAEHANEPSKDGSYKVLSRTFVLKPNEACTHSYLVLNAYDSQAEADQCVQFLQSKLARFLILQTVSGIDLSAERFSFVPLFDYASHSTDAALYAKYDLDEKDIEYIERTIRAWVN